MKNFSTTQHGFFLIEVVVASSIIAIVLILLIGSIQNTVEVSERSLEQTQAAYLLEEGAEATKAIRDTSWAQLAALTNTTTYYLSYNGTTWTTTTTANTIDRFTRTVIFSPVYRNGTDDIAATGTLDTGVRLVTVTVSWSAPSGNQSKTLSFYIANIRE